MKKLCILILAGLLLVTAGCTTKKPPETGKVTPPAKPPKSETVPKEQPKPLLVGTEIKDKDILAWKETYKKQRGVFTQDFGKYRAILIGLGEQPTGGYAINLKKAEQVQSTWVIDFSATRPKPGEVTTQAITYPHELLAITKDQKPIEVYELVGPDRIKQDLTTTPVGKVSFSKSFIVDLPKEGSEVTSPMKIKGLASVFEGAFSIFLEDGHNRLAEKNVQTAGAPAWGEFQLELPYEKPTSPSGMLIFAYGSPATGEIIEELKIPVKFK